MITANEDTQQPSALLSPMEKRHLRARLSEWQAPSAALEVAGLVDSGILFNQAGLAFVRDAWIGAELGRRRGADRVRLVSGEWPDFELDFQGRFEMFEAVEVLDPIRRRGLEYQQEIGKGSDDPYEEWLRRAGGIAAWLEDACRSKAEKRYSERFNLAVYLNVGEYGIQQQEIEAALSPATAAAKDAFASVWVLWKEEAYLTWSFGVRAHSRS